MKPAKKITRVHLNIRSDADSSLLGIVSAEADYKLSLTINRTLGLSLRNSDPVVIPDESGNSVNFSRFADTTHHEKTCSLISNRSGIEVLIKKLPRIDYFFMIHSDEEEIDLEAIATELRSIGSITALFIFKNREIKDKNLGYLA